MKIADVSEFYSERGGGVRTYVHQKLAASARLGHETIIIAPGAHDAEEHHPGGKIVWVTAPALPVDRRYHMFTEAKGVYAVLDREAPDVVEGSSPWRGGWLAGRWPGRALKVLVMHADPVAVYAHTFLDRWLARPQIDRLFGWFWHYLRRLNAPYHVTVVAGEWLARRFEGFGLKGLAAVPFGIDRHLFHDGLRDKALRAEMLRACGLSESAPLLLAIGRHHPEKRLPTLIAAVDRANDGRSGVEPFGLYLVGDGLARAAVERAASRAPHVHVAGHVDDRAHVARLMASTDALIHGSGCETFGLAVAETLCCATPVIVPDTGGAFDFAGPDYAEVYALGDPHAAADAIIRLFARDRDRLSAAARHAAETRIGSADAHFDRLFALYAQQLRQAR